MNRIVWLNEHLLYWNGGIRYIYEVTSRLAKLGNRVNIFVTQSSEVNYIKFLKSKVDIISLSNVSANKIKYWIFYPFYLINNAIKLSKLLMSDDIIISSSPTCNLWCFLLRRKYMEVVFELNPWLYNRDYALGLSLSKRAMIALAGPFMRILDKLSHQYVNKVFVHSNFVKSEVQRIYGRDVDVEIVHDGVDPVFFRKTFSVLDDEYRDREVLLHIASYLNPMKGTKYAIEAMQTVVQQIPNALLVILNFNNDVAEQKKLRDLACLLGIEDNIIFVVGVGDIDVVRYYSLSKVLLQPSLDENVHLPPLEAAACECPSVVFDGLFSSEEVIDRETGYIVPRYQSSAMGIAAIDLIRHSVLRNDFGVKSREYVMKNFSWDQCVLKYIERIK